MIKQPNYGGTKAPKTSVGKVTIDIDHTTIDDETQRRLWLRRSVSRFPSTVKNGESERIVDDNTVEYWRYFYDISHVTAKVSVKDIEAKKLSEKSWENCFLNFVSGSSVVPLSIDTDFYDVSRCLRPRRARFNSTVQVLHYHDKRQSLSVCIHRRMDIECLLKCKIAS